MSASARFFRVANRLAAILGKSGGISRNQAIENASKAVEKLRDDFTGALLREVMALESLVRGHKGPVSDKTLREIELRSIAIYNLAATFGFKVLQDVAASLLDLIALMKPMTLRRIEPIAVHIQAARLASPDVLQLPESVAVALLDELKKVTAHFERDDRAA